MIYLYDKDDIVYAKCINCDRVLKFHKYQLPEIKSGVECFCGQYSAKIDGLPDYLLNPQNQNTQTVNTAYTFTSSLPKCPTCGSTNVSKISLSSKAVGGAAFGIFSSNVRHTFKCNNCGYKW